MAGFVSAVLQGCFPPQTPQCPARSCSLGRTWGRCHRQQLRSSASPRVLRAPGPRAVPAAPPQGSSPSPPISPGSPSCGTEKQKLSGSYFRRCHIYLTSLQMKTSIWTYGIQAQNLITFFYSCKSAFLSATLLLKPVLNWWCDT